jgi:hypothetical protein
MHYSDEWNGTADTAEFERDWALTPDSFDVTEDDYSDRSFA